ncbi:MAG TPA: hypothetical protein PLI89_14060 [Chitinophagales bacterium]|nr:hypothetical protein [Chitinophagales bacterium]
MTSEVYNMDCIEGMKQYPDKHFDLAVVDPPYGFRTEYFDAAEKRYKEFTSQLVMF